MTTPLTGLLPQASSSPSGALSSETAQPTRWKKIRDIAVRIFRALTDFLSTIFCCFCRKAAPQPTTAVSVPSSQQGQRLESASVPVATPELLAALTVPVSSATASVASVVAPSRVNPPVAAETRPSSADNRPIADTSQRSSTPTPLSNQESGRLNLHGWNDDYEEPQLPDTPREQNQIESDEQLLSTAPADPSSQQARESDAYKSSLSEVLHGLKTVSGLSNTLTTSTLAVTGVRPKAPSNETLYNKYCAVAFLRALHETVEQGGGDQVDLTDKNAFQALINFSFAQAQDQLGRGYTREMTDIISSLIPGRTVDSAICSNSASLKEGFLGSATHSEERPKLFMGVAVKGDRCFAFYFDNRFLLSRSYLYCLSPEAEGPELTIANLDRNLLALLKPTSNNPIQLFVINTRQ